LNSKMKECKKFDLMAYIHTRRKDIDRALDEYLPGEEVYPQQLHRAMRYSVFSGGKRFRPILSMASFEACGGQGTGILPVACAIELIHTYSLIHDDLPCMDDDDLRRGKPTSHKVFGEALAVLAGDALLTHAVEIVVRQGRAVLGPERTTRVLEVLTGAIGAGGMVAGQVVDMQSEGRNVDEATVEYIHTRKTGALIAAAATCGATVAGAGPALVERLTGYGHKVGLAFQITDDILDAEGRFGQLKSGSHLDRRRRKATYPAVFGMERSKRMARELLSQAKDVIADLGDAASPLVALAELVVNRSS
jgi:geranylgeranyl diphosphate synthase type II